MTPPVGHLDRTPARPPDPLRDPDRAVGALVLAAGAVLTLIDRLRGRA